jgi:cyclohexadieny/prephenate dehydrogenase
MARLAKFWRALGAHVELMDAGRHDFVLAATSHLPHLVAYNLVGTVAEIEAGAEAEVMKFSAGGFRDFTRIAASDPIMWRDVFQLNGEAVLRVVDSFAEGLDRLREAIRAGDGATLEDLFRRTRDVRAAVIAMGQESSEPNFGRDRRKGP